MTGVEHHAHDLGRILVQAQADLARIRSTITAESGGQTDRRLLAVVERVESEMKMKADAVLHSVIHGSPATLPTLGSYNFGGGASTSSLPASSRLPGSQSTSRLQLPSRNRMAPSVKAQTRRQQQQLSKALMNPTSVASREFLEQRFGIAAPPPPPLASEVRRNVGKTATGKLAAAKTSGPLGVIASEYRRDPDSEPPIRPRDVAAGLLSLTQRGLLPPHVDLTPALAREPAPVTQAPSRLHDPKTQFTPSAAAAYTSPFGFNVANTKLDLLSDVGPTYAERGPRKPPMAQAHVKSVAPATVTLTLEGSKSSTDASEEAAAALASAEAQKARDFNQLMDTFSLHHYIIRHGMTLESTPEYVSFERKYNSEWGAISQLNKKLEAMLKKYDVPLAYVDGQKLVALARNPLVRRDERALLGCLVNDDQVAKCMNLPGQRFRGGGEGARRAALIEIQSGARRFLAVRAVKRFQYLFDAAHRMTRRWHTKRMWAALKARLREDGVERAAAWREMQEAFRRDWPVIRASPRVVVHIPSLSYAESMRASMSNLDVKQSAQLPRLCEIMESGVDVIFVSPFPLNDDVMHYFQKVLEIGGIEDPLKRLKIIVPENYNRFPPHFSLSTILFYSPRAMRRIANFCRGRTAYIAPNVVGREDVRLSQALRLPLLGPEDNVARTFGSKSGAKRIFQAASVNIPPGAHDVYDEQSLIIALSGLICAHLDVPRWVVKLDDECGGRGCAHLDVASLPFYAALVREAEGSPARWEEEQTQARAREMVRVELEALLPSKMTINARWLFRNWREYLSELRRGGAVIEASPGDALRSSPSCNLFIEPDGTVKVTSTHEQILSSPYTFVGAAFPQTEVPAGALREAALAVGRAAYDRGVMGRVGIDFVAFEDASGLLRVWAVDLNIRYTPTALSFTFFNFLAGGEYDEETGQYIVPSEDNGALGTGGSAASTPRRGPAPGVGQELQRRTYIMNEMFYHPQLPSIHHSAFFNMCRLKGVSFDLQDRSGTVFNLMDSFAGGVLGILTVGPSRLEALRKFTDCMDFVQKQVGPAPSRHEPADSSSHDVTFQDVIRAIKALVDKQVGGPTAPAARYLRAAR